jgi:hypothetical protein
VLPRPQGLSGTAVRGPACTVVWEPGGETLRATQLNEAATGSYLHPRLIELECYQVEKTAAHNKPNYSFPHNDAHTMSANPKQARDARQNTRYQDAGNKAYGQIEYRAVATVA